MHVVRFRMPDAPDVQLNDGVRGKITWDSIPLRDPVLLKSDGFPTYHLAVVVDDYDMEISHALRGEEWIASAPLHLMLYKALGWESPVFCHLPVVLGSDGKKLSKRHGAVSWSTFKEQGYLPEAILNFIALIGWSPGEGDQEIFSREQLIEKFSLERVNQASGVFEYTKLTWMNSMYQRELDDSELYERTLPHLEESSSIVSKEQFIVLAESIKERAKTLVEIPPLLTFLDANTLKRDFSGLIKKGLEPKQIVQILNLVSERLEGIDSFRSSEIHDCINPIGKELELKKPGHVFITLRIAVTGNDSKLPIFDSFEVLGKEEVMRRLDQAKSESALR